LVDTVKFVGIVDKYEVSPQFILEKRKEFRAECVDELEEFRCKPKSDIFDRSAFL
jgi:hypothetical protein